jgi:hypothetical protein
MEADGAMSSVYGNGGPNGARVWWPAGLGELAPADRVAALARGWWDDGDHVVFADGRREYRPAEARRLRRERDRRG